MFFSGEKVTIKISYMLTVYPDNACLEIYSDVFGDARTDWWSKPPLISAARSPAPEMTGRSLCAVVPGEQSYLVKPFGN